jgi:predicted type IV restriction endonuclease
MESPAKPTPAVNKAKRKSAAPAASKIAFSAKTVKRLKDALPLIKRDAKILAARGEAEADTRLLVVDVMTALGWDKTVDLTGESRVRGDAMDYLLKVDGVGVAALEVKSSSVPLKEKHLRQVEKYAADSGFEWMILTNGHHWQLYHLTFNRPLVIDLISEIDLFDDLKKTPVILESLLIFSKESFSKKFVAAKWRARIATAPEQLRTVLLSKEVVNAFRKELRKKSGQLLPLDETVRVLREWLKV